MANNENRELIVSIRVQIEHLPLSRCYRGLQVELDKLSHTALLDLQEMLSEVESRGLGKKKPVPARCKYCNQMEDLVAGLCEDCAADEEEDDSSDCPECNGGEVYEGEADVSSCGRCEGTGTLS